LILSLLATFALAAAPADVPARVTLLDVEPPIETGPSAHLLEPPPKDLTVGGVLWRVAGVWGGGSHGAALGLVGLPLVVQAAGGKGNVITFSAWSGLAVGFLLGGYPGFLLGRLADEGVFWAKALVVALDALSLPILLVGGLTYAGTTGNFPGGG
jgi:hypothetical protein